MIKNFFIFVVAMLSGALLYSGYFLYLRDVPKPTETIPTKAHSLKIKGSIPYWDQDRAFVSFKNNVDDFDYVNLFWYFIDKKGHIQKYTGAHEDQGILQFARAHGVKTSMVVTNLPQEEDTTWDSARVEYVLQHMSVRKYEIDEITQKAKKLGFDGVTIDYESVASSEKDRFSDFIQELATRLHKNNLFLSVALHSKTNDTDNPGRFQNWKQIAQYADHLQIMAYGEHWDEGEAGPIASISWVKEILSYAISLDIPKQKIFLGIPLYGYSWQKNNNDKAKGLTYTEINNLVRINNIKPQWDTDSQSPYFLYSKKGDRFEVWYEDKQSVLAKKRLAEQFSIEGITFWRLGDEDPSIWNLFAPASR